MSARAVSGFADRNETRVEFQGDGRAQDEPSGLQADDRVDARARVPVGDGGHHGAQRGRGRQQRGDVLERDARLGEVGNVADARRDQVAQVVAAGELFGHGVGSSRLRRRFGVQGWGIRGRGGNDGEQRAPAPRCGAGAPVPRRSPPRRRGGQFLGPPEPPGKSGRSSTGVSSGVPWPGVTTSPMPIFSIRIREPGEISSSTSFSRTSTTVP